MDDAFGPMFINATDEDGNELVLEYVDTVEYEGSLYYAFFPAQEEDAPEDPDSGLIIMKVIRENGEELLSTPDSDEELEAVYDRFMEQLFDEDD